MIPLTRRTLLATGAAGTLATLTAGLARPARAEAPMLGPSRPTFRRFTLGTFEVTTLLDGAAPVPDPHTIFGTTEDPAAVAALLEANSLPTAAAEFTFIPVLVNTGASLILFDTGNGAAARPARGNLAAQVTAAGYAPEQVDTVVITHMHPDHIGGMLEDGAPAFANADYVTGAAEYDFFASADRMGSPAEGVHTLVTSNVTPFAERMRFIAPGESVVPGIEAMDAFGHTPGHMIYHIESAGARLVLTADTANHFVLSLQRPDWEVRFDMDKEAAAATRRRVFGMLAADRVPFIGYHMPFPGLGYVTAADDGFRFEPASYQFNI